MNKKFITILAAGLLTSSASLFAQDLISGAKTGDIYMINFDGETREDYVGTPTAANAFSIEKKEVYVVEKAFKQAWEITVYPSPTATGNPTYEFVNRATGKKFAVDLRTYGATSTASAKYSEYGNTVWGYGHGVGLYAVAGDSLFYFKSGVLKSTDGTLATAKGALKTTTRSNVEAGRWGAFTLTPDAFNYLVSKTGGKLKFGNGKNVKGEGNKNILTEKKWHAASFEKGATSATAKQFMLASEDSTTNTDSRYNRNPYVLVVDTLYYDTTGKNKYPMLTTDTLDVKPEHDPTTGEIDATNYTALLNTKGIEDGKRYRNTAVFYGYYMIENDSIALNAAYAPNPSTITATESTSIADKDVEYLEIKGVQGFGRLALQNLTDGTVVLTPTTQLNLTGSPSSPLNPTINPTNKELNADNYVAPLIQSGISYDPAVDNRTSVEDGVYFITKTDADGKVRYLAAPIKNTTSTADGGNEAEWIVLDSKKSQNPEDMPAYQWVVLKDNTSAAASATSSVTVTNREYPSLPTTSTSTQLFKKAGAKYMYTTKGAVTSIVAATDSLTFTAVSKASVEDKHLGYKHFDKDQLQATRYTFRYYHPYANDKYIAKNENDSITAVLNGKTFFALKEVGLSSYGYTVTKDAKTRIPGLAQLVRTAYIPFVKAVDSLYFDVDTDNHMVLSQYQAAAAGVAAGTAAPQDSFYFKTNNEYPLGVDGSIIDYHALLNLNATIPAKTKAGVTENDPEALLKDQPVDATYTSVFYIAPADAPLYRRFDSELEGKAGDAADTLRFEEKYYGEYLQVENNSAFKKKGVDFLGISTPEYTEDGKSFIVDTAWVKSNLNILFLSTVKTNLLQNVYLVQNV